MNFKPQELANAGIGSVSLLANVTFDGFERLAALNLSAGRSYFEACFANVNALLGTTDVKSFVDLQQKLATPAIDKGMEYSRNLFAIATETKDKIAKEVELALQPSMPMSPISSTRLWPPHRPVPMSPSKRSRAR